YFHLIFYYYWPKRSSSTESFVSISNPKTKNTLNSKEHPSSVIDSSESEVNSSIVENDSAQEPVIQQAGSNELSFVHDAVLLQETVSAVLGVKTLPKQTDDSRQNSLQKSGICVDVTFGRGGHSRLLDRKST